MPENEKKESKDKKTIFRVTKYSRRQFLKSAAIVAAGTAMASVSLASACKSSDNAATGTTTSPTTTTTMPTTTTTTPTTTTTTPTSTIPPTSTPPTTGYNYVPSKTPPPLVQVGSTSCTVATDRLYTENNIWVLSLSTYIAVMGVTSTMVDILAEPYSLSLSPIGTQMNAGDDFGSMEGYKLSTDLTSPISGIIIEVNSYETIPVGQGGNIQDINVDPYGIGWLVVVQLSNPSQLNSLLTPQQYINYVGTL